MSKKTVFKRVALVAAAALAIGGVTAVSSYAAAGQAAPSLGATTATAVPGAYTTAVLTAGTNDQYYTITSSGVGSVLYPASAVNAGGDTSGLLASGSSEVWYAGASPAAGNFNANGNDVLTFSAYSAVAGTQTITFTGTTTAAFTETITWGAAPVASAANSLVIATKAANINVGTVQESTSDTLTPVLKSVVATTDYSTAGVGIYVQLENNATSPAVVTTDQISASVSGPGLLKIGSANGSGAAGLKTAANGASAGRSVVAAANGYALVYVYADGTAGTSTITLADATTGITLGTVTVVFYSSTIAKLVATTNFTVPLATVTGFTATPTEGFASLNTETSGVAAPVTLVASDANGNAVPSADGTVANINVSSSNTTVATATTVKYDATNSFYFPVINPVSEGSTTLTFTDALTGLITATATVWVTSAVVAKVVASTDAASYDPGTKVVYTLTATDAAGNPVPDGSYAAFLTAAPTSNVGLQGALVTAVTPYTGNVTFLGGVNNSTVYAPVSSANVAIAGGTLGVGASVATALQGTTLNEADFSTTGSSDTAANAATDAANEATDAANAATDAANAAADSADAATQAAQDAGDKADAALAAVTALSQRVTAVLAKIASISALLVRIIKKVKA
ncbi:MAG: hypothetical protein WDN07_00715 [Actinomycetota bacterium]